jgi:hypothetical protein
VLGADHGVVLHDLGRRSEAYDVYSQARQRMAGWPQVRY